MVDPRHGTHLITLYPIDKESNADRRRRALPPLAAEPTAPEKPAGIAPLLRQYMAEYSATGLPPAYVPLARDCLDEAQVPVTDNPDDSQMADCPNDNNGE